MVAGTKLDRVRTANRYLGSEEFRDRILSYEHRAPGIQYRYNLLCFKPVFFFFLYSPPPSMHTQTGMLCYAKPPKGLGGAQWRDEVL